MMLPFAVGTTEILIVVGVIVLLFGAKKIPELAKSLGEGIRELKKSTQTPTDEKEDAKTVENESKKDS